LIGEKNMDTKLKEQIDSLIKNNPVILFMKGSKDYPQCGFSKRAVTLVASLADVFTVDVLSDPALREGIKEYSSWPTIPQLYINQEFIGGCDIIEELYTKRELHQLLSPKKSNEPAPVKDISPHELYQWHKEQKDMLVIDVRPQDERAIAHISFAKPLYSFSNEDWAHLSQDKTLIFHCHHGQRSKKEAESFRLKGFNKVYNLTGGIDAWSKQVDKSVPIY
jgi:monothiol glutaredoxin